jgi:hypothetical protein
MLRPGKQTSGETVAVGVFRGRLSDPNGHAALHKIHLTIAPQHEI